MTAQRSERSFGVLLRRFRERAGLTQEQLAAAAGLTEKGISALERGERRYPYPHTVHALAGALRLNDAERDALLEARAEARRANPAAAPPLAAEQPAAIQPALAPTLLATRLVPPPLRHTVVPRPRLLNRIATLPPGAVLLIVAPAGFGKTTLVTSWLAQGQIAEGRLQNESALCNLPSAIVAWLSLDGSEADPVLLLRYLLAALRRAVPTLGETALALLEASQPQVQGVLAVLLNEVAQLAQPLLLLLDDCHLLRGRENQELLRALVEGLSPPVRLVLIAREEPPLPLGKLRARGQLVELRANDLRFTPAEATSFLQDAMGLSLGNEAVAALERRTEGWAAGLQLAALALRDRADAEGFIRNFAGSHRLVLDYLGEEVLDRLPPHLQTFLLQTAILDRLCGPLCDALLGLQMVEGGLQMVDMDRPISNLQSAISNDSYSQLILDQLERMSLFLIPLDDGRVWYRYHHLFAEVLRARLLRGASPATVATLHGRAAAWYGAQGLWAEAIPHALAAQQWEVAAGALARIGDDLLAQGALGKVRELVAALPEQVCAAHPRLLLLNGICALRDMDITTARASLHAAVAAYEAAGHLLGRGETLVHLADYQRTVGDFAAAQATLQEALAHPLPPRPHMSALVSSAWQWLALGRWRESVAAMDAALALAEQSADHRLAVELMSNVYLTLLVLPRRAAWLERLLRRVAAIPGPRPLPLQMTAAKLGGIARWLRGDIAGAKAQIDEGMALLVQMVDLPVWKFDLFTLHTIMLMLAGDIVTAERRLLELLDTLAQPTLAPHLRSWGAFYHCYLAWLYWQQGKIDEVWQVAEEMDAAIHPQEWPSSPTARLLVRGMLALAENDLPAAQRLLAEAHALQQQFADAIGLGDARMVLALGYQRAGRPDDALPLLAAAIGDHLSWGTPGLLLGGGAQLMEPLLVLASANNIHSAAVRRLLRALGAGGDGS